MILQFAIEPEVLKDVADRGTWASFVDGLEQFWPSHGVLVMPSDFDKTFNQSGLDSHRLSEWKKLVTHEAHRKSYSPKEFVGFDWATVESWKDLKPCDNKIDLALLQDVRAAVFGLIEDDVPCLHDPRQEVLVEIARGHHLSSTCRVQDLRELATKVVGPIGNPDQIWEQRLRKHAMHSTSVAVVDKFAIENRQGLHLLLEKLVTDGWQSGAKTQTVDVYSSYKQFHGQGPGSPSSIRSELEAEAVRISNKLNSQVLNVQVNVNLLHQADVPHDRWIRFDKNIIELGKGLEILEANRKQAFSFQLKREDAEREKQESYLRSLCKNKRDSGPPYLCVSAYPPRYGSR